MKKSRITWRVPIRNSIPTLGLTQAELQHFLVVMLQWKRQDNEMAENQKSGGEGCRTNE